jgi:tetratricopeptide (TPR) repeat protein
MGIDTKNIDTLYYQASVLREEGKYKQALVIYSKILKLDLEGNIENMQSMGYAMQYLEKPEEAIQLYDVILKIPNPRSQRVEYFYNIAFYNKGVALFNLGKYHEAISIFNKVVVIDSDGKFRIKSLAVYFKNEALKLLRQEQDRPY